MSDMVAGIMVPPEGHDCATCKHLYEPARGPHCKDCVLSWDNGVRDNWEPDDKD